MTKETIPMTQPKSQRSRQPRVFAESRCSTNPQAARLGILLTSLVPVDCRRLGSVSHSIDDVVDADAIRQRCSAFGILGTVGPFPGVADIGISADGDHDATFIVPSARHAGMAISGVCERRLPRSHSRHSEHKPDRTNLKRVTEPHSSSKMTMI